VTDWLRLDENELTIGDLEDFEDIVGSPWEDIRPGPDSAVKMSTKAIKALVFIARRKTDPSFTLEMARDVKLGELRIEPLRSDPTPAAG